MKKGGEIARIAVFFLILILLPVLTFALPKKDFSFEENRELAGPPVFRADTLLDRTFMDGVEDYMADHFPGRTGWVEAKGLIQMAAGVREIGGVWLCGDRMIQVQSPVNDRYMKDNALTVTDYAEAFHTRPAVLLVPDAGSLMTGRVPSGADVSDRREFFRAASDLMNRQADLPDLYPVLAGRDPASLYYHTDHHWTADGAYAAYCLLGKTLGYEPYPAEAFRVETGEKPFYGSLYSKCLIRAGIQADRVSLWQLKDRAPKLTVKDGSGALLSDSVFFRENLNQKDQYLVYLGKNRGVTVIENSAMPDGKDLLLVKDSYANALAPFLALHYRSVTLIDPRYYRGDLQNVIPEGGFDQTLFCFGYESFCAQNALSKLIF